MEQAVFSVEAQRGIRRKLRILEEVVIRGNISATCRHFGISRDSVYRWKRLQATRGQDGLVNGKPCPVNLKARTPKPTEELILHLRTVYHLGQQRIVWYLKCYHQIRISIKRVCGVLLRHGLDRLPRNVPKRTLLTTR